MRRHAVLTVSLSLLPLCFVRAQDAALAELLQAAEEHNPELRAARAEADAVAARRVATASLPDPQVALAYTNDGWAPTLGERDMTTLLVMASQALPAPGKRGLRQKRALSEARMSAAQADGVRRALRAAIKRAYAALRLARGSLALRREQAELLQQVEGVARARYALGQGAQQDVLRAQVELTRVEPTLSAGEAAARERLYELNRLAGRALEAPVEPPAEWLLAPVAGTGDDWRREFAAQNPQQRLLDEQAQAAGLDVELARREFRPDWALQAGYMNRGGLPPMWQAGLSLSLPVRRARLRAGVAEAQARGRALEARRDALEADVALLLATRLSQLSTLETQLALYERGLLPQGRLSVEAAVTSYQAGKLPFVGVLEALSSLYADRAERLSLLATHATLVAGLEEAQVEPAATAASPMGR